MIITVDGPAAAGKGTLSQKLAEKYCLAYFDTGMVYRAVGLLMLQNGNDLADATAAEQEAAGLTFAKWRNCRMIKIFVRQKEGRPHRSFPAIRECGGGCLICSAILRRIRFCRRKCGERRYL